MENVRVLRDITERQVGGGSIIDYCLTIFFISAFGAIVYCWGWSFLEACV
jgi:hypothetical protein